MNQKPRFIMRSRTFFTPCGVWHGLMYPRRVDAGGSGFRFAPVEPESAEFDGDGARSGPPSADICT